MALTGLFLILFLVGHLAGNLQLMASNEGEAARLQFNAYARFMTTNPVVKLLSYLTYFSVLLHVIYSIVLTRLNRVARPQGYHNQYTQASWASRNMGVLGTLILIFLIIHLRGFWYEMHWGGIALDSAGNKDLYAVVAASYTQLWYVALYVVSMVFLGYHLSHGFSSAWQTFGLYHRSYTPAIKVFGLLFAIVVSGLFAIIPIYMYLVRPAGF